jgi:hypothetical protein
MPTPIRCINDRTHGIYDSCGALLGAIDDDAIYFRCPTCPSNAAKWIKVYKDSNGGICIKPLPKKISLQFTDELMMIT